MTHAAKRPLAPHASAIGAADEQRPKAAVSAPESANARTIGARRPPSLTVEPTMNWPSAYIASIDESISPSAESERPASLTSVDFTTETGLRAK